MSSPVTALAVSYASNFVFTVLFCDVVTENAIFLHRTRPQGLFADRPALHTRSHSADAPRRIESAHLILPLAPPERLRNDARARAMEELQSGVQKRSTAALSGGGSSATE